MYHYHHHSHVDLSLASSYLPGCACIAKSSVSFVIFLFSPVRGWIALCTLLITDRVLWNTQNCILDVNAVCTALVGGLMIVRARGDAGSAAVVGCIFTVAWMLMSMLQVLGATRLHHMYEVLVGALVVSILSCVFQKQETPEILAVRSFIFTTANVVLPYLGIVLHQQQPDVDSSCVIICRTLPILLADSELACAWVVMYMLCIGYQAKRVGSTSINKGYCCDGKPSSAMPVETLEKSSPLVIVAVAADDPAQQLREALARKQQQMCPP